MNIQFGSGVLFASPNNGDLAANPTPYKIGILQDVQLTFKADLKKLYGQQQFPVASARGKVDVSAKGKLALLDPGMINQIYFGQAAAPGITAIADSESHTVPAALTPAAHAVSTPYALGAVITDGTNVEVCVVAGTSGPSAPTWNLNIGGLTVDGSATFLNVGPAVSSRSPVSVLMAANAATLVNDFGAAFAATGQQLACVTGAAMPAEAQYYPTSYGVYLFASADAAAAVAISYTYTIAGRGTTVSLNNQLMGYAPYFRAFLYNNLRGKFFGIQLNNCVCGSLGVATKQDDWWIMDIDFDAMADAGNNLGALIGDTF